MCLCMWGDVGVLCSKATATALPSDSTHTHPLIPVCLCYGRIRHAESAGSWSKVGGRNGSESPRSFVSTCACIFSSAQLSCRVDGASYFKATGCVVSLFIFVANVFSHCCVVLKCPVTVNYLHLKKNLFFVTGTFSFLPFKDVRVSARFTCRYKLLLHQIIIIIILILLRDVRLLTLFSSSVWWILINAWHIISTLTHTTHHRTELLLLLSPMLPWLAQTDLAQIQ